MSRYLFPRVVPGLLMLSLLCGCIPYVNSAAPTGTSAPADAWLPADANARFQKANSAREFSFPEDHAAHPDFQTEWWYFTGNLQAEDGSLYGYELTFFRRGLTADPAERTSVWATNEIYMAHLAITDGKTNHFEADQRFSRSSLDLAGASGDSLTSSPQPHVRIWLLDWSAEQVDTDRWMLSAANDSIALHLNLDDTTGPVLQGDQGLSRKSAGNASYYYSMPRLKTSGTLLLNNRTVEVTGSSWMDHEFSTSALAADQVGWDWYALQLDDGRQLMLYTLRRTDGTIDPFSSGTLIAADGTLTHLTRTDFSIAVQGSWISPHSGATYPSGWQIELPTQGISVRVVPLIRDQELNLAFTYWEGAVTVSGSTSGVGYVELTGYAASMQGQL